jgi:hypothetical protein
MSQRAKDLVKKALQMKPSPRDAFLYFDYIRHDQRRLEHLASLNLPIAGATVLEVGAGIGGHTSFFLDRGCRVLSTEARDDNLEVLRQRYPDLEVKPLDLDYPDTSIVEKFDIVYCYGLLYHLKEPAGAVEYMSSRCSKMLLLETCVSLGNEASVNLCPEAQENLNQSVHGMGCRPTRPWVFNHLKNHFNFVYMPLTQPNHLEFPLDWTSPIETGHLMRSVFVASREQLDNSLLVTEIPMLQRRH